MTGPLNVLAIDAHGRRDAGDKGKYACGWACCGLLSGFREFPARPSLVWPQAGTAAFSPERATFSESALRGNSTCPVPNGRPVFMASERFTLLPHWPASRKVVIGMIHLRPLPASPRYAGDLSAVREAAVRDAAALAEGGVDGLMIENFGDVPFYPGRVPAYVVSHMTALAAAVRGRFDLPLGINVLRNDGLSALAVAHAAGAEFVRVNVLCGARVADQGLLQGIAHDLLRERAVLGATGVKILADVDVKHSAAVAARELADEVDDTVARGLADGVIVSGAGTGKTTALEKVQRVKAVAGGTPVFVGSGVSADTVRDYAPYADGFIVGTAFKRDRDPANPVEVDRVRALMSAIR